MRYIYFFCSIILMNLYRSVSCVHVFFFFIGIFGAARRICVFVRRSFFAGLSGRFWVLAAAYTIDVFPCELCVCVIRYDSYTQDSINRRVCLFFFALLPCYSFFALPNINGKSLPFILCRMRRMFWSLLDSFTRLHNVAAVFIFPCCCCWKNNNAILTAKRAGEE